MGGYRWRGRLCYRIVEKNYFKITSPRRKRGLFLCLLPLPDHPQQLLALATGKDLRENEGACLSSTINTWKYDIAYTYNLQK